MTIITKPSNEKKGEKLVPLVVAGGAGTEANQPSAPSIVSDLESIPDANSVIIRRRRHPFTTIFLFLAALAVMCMGILGGFAIYRLYSPSRMDQLRFHGFCGIPYDSQSASNAELIQYNNDMKTEDNEDLMFKLSEAIAKAESDANEFFHEEFELNSDKDEDYTKITVPDFRDERQGRFLHDFKDNQSAIIDVKSNRCFVMPLDREHVLPPKSMFDLLMKMWNGYYNIDTSEVRKNMRVILPKVENMTDISERIAGECNGMNVYQLEKFVSGVFKRSAELSLPSAGKYGYFAGNNIIKTNIVNIDALNEYEKKL